MLEFKRNRYGILTAKAGKWGFQINESRRINASATPFWVVAVRSTKKDVKRLDTGTHQRFATTKEAVAFCEALADGTTTMEEIQARYDAEDAERERRAIKAATEQAMTVYIDGQPVAATGTLPEIELEPLEQIEAQKISAESLAASLEFKIEPEQAARVVAALTEAWQAVVLAFEPMAAAFSEWIRAVAGAVAAEEELETALRWASCDNRPLFNRYRHTKKKRIRKKYTKRILAWYREAGLAPPKHNDGLDAATYAARRLGTCYDAEFWGADDCANTACPYYNADKGPMRCLAAEGCPGRETEVGTDGNP